MFFCMFRACVYVCVVAPVSVSVSVFFLACEIAQACVCVFMNMYTHICVHPCVCVATSHYHPMHHKVLPTLPPQKPLESGPSPTFSDPSST